MDDVYGSRTFGNRNARSPSATRMLHLMLGSRQDFGHRFSGTDRLWYGTQEKGAYTFNTIKYTATTQISDPVNTLLVKEHAAHLFEVHSKQLLL